MTRFIVAEGIMNVFPSSNYNDLIEHRKAAIPEGVDISITIRISTCDRVIIGDEVKNAHSKY